jgi:hypothetical protein
MVVGFGVGIAVGVAIDWWMTDRFQEKLTRQCDDFLNGVEGELIEGTPPSPGLRAILEESIRLNHASQRAAALASLIEGQP